MSLPTPVEVLRSCRRRCRRKPSRTPGYRFYTLWDKVCRADVLWRSVSALPRQRRRTGRGWSDVRRSSSQYGVEPWLDGVAGGASEEGVSPAAPPAGVDSQAERRDDRPLGIPTIRDRVVQMAVLLVIGPIFEADLCDEQYGFRSGVECQDGCGTGVLSRDCIADMRRWSTRTCPDYFNTIPHGRVNAMP